MGIADKFDLIVIFEPEKLKNIPILGDLYNLRIQDDKMLSLFLFHQVKIQIRTFVGVGSKIDYKAVVILRIILSSMPFTL